LLICYFQSQVGNVSTKCVTCWTRKIKRSQKACVRLVNGAHCVTCENTFRPAYLYISRMPLAIPGQLVVLSEMDPDIASFCWTHVCTTDAALIAVDTAASNANWTRGLLERICADPFAVGPNIYVYKSRDGNHKNAGCHDGLYQRCYFGMRRLKIGKAT
jgi:hypothetical protein